MSDTYNSLEFAVRDLTEAVNKLNENLEKQRNEQSNSYNPLNEIARSVGIIAEKLEHKY